MTSDFGVNSRQNYIATPKIAEENSRKTELAKIMPEFTEEPKPAPAHAPVPAFTEEPKPAEAPNPAPVPTNEEKCIFTEIHKPSLPINVLNNTEHETTIYAQKQEKKGVEEGGWDNALDFFQEQAEVFEELNKADMEISKEKYEQLKAKVPKHLKLSETELIEQKLQEEIQTEIIWK